MTEKSYVHERRQYRTAEDEGERRDLPAASLLETGDDFINTYPERQDTNQVDTAEYNRIHTIIPLNAGEPGLYKVEHVTL